MTRRLDLNTDKIVKQYKDGMTTAEIAAEHGCHQSTIRDRLIPLGILRKCGSRRKAKSIKSIKKYIPKENMISIKIICDKRIVGKNISGIYSIYCTGNKKLYVGSSKGIYSRIKNHMSLLRNKKHVNNHLQNAYYKYGEDNFFLEILETCNKENLIDRENFWIHKTGCLDKNIGFNKRDGACGGTTISGKDHYLYGKSLPQETKDKISESRKGKCSGKTHWAFGKKILTKERLSRMLDAKLKKYPPKPKIKRLSRRESKLGSKNSVSKLTENDVKEIKRLINNGTPGKIIAEKFLVSKSCICDIKKNRTWSHIDG